MANKTSMKLVLQVEEGKNRSKTISNINPAATNETLSAAAAKLTSAGYHRYYIVTAGASRSRYHCK